MQNNKVIYIPEQGMPLIVPQTHIYARSLLEAEFTYVELPAMSGFQYVLYHPAQRSGAQRNQWLSNLYKGAGYAAEVRGPALAVVTRSADERRSGAIVARAGELVQPGTLHLELLHDAVFNDAVNRAAMLKM
jgi:hypothetical protein